MGRQSFGWELQQAWLGTRQAGSTSRRDRRRGKGATRLGRARNDLAECRRRPAAGQAPRHAAEPVARSGPTTSTSERAPYFAKTCGRPEVKHLQANDQQRIRAASPVSSLSQDVLFPVLQKSQQADRHPRYREVWDNSCDLLTAGGSWTQFLPIIRQKNRHRTFPPDGCAYFGLDWSGSQARSPRGEA